MVFTTQVLGSTMWGGAGTQTLIFTAANDQAVFEGTFGAGLISLGQGNDQATFNSTISGTTILGTENADTLSFSASTNSVVFGSAIGTAAQVSFGSGLDMATFSVLTLFYRVNEKVATPTSVILMAINAVLGMCFRFAGIGGQYAEGEQEAVWNFVAVCIPIVVIGAPIGATISARVSRHVISGFIYFLDTVQFISAIAIIQPWSKPHPNNIGLSVACVGTLLIGSGFFWLLANAGEAKQEIANQARQELVNSPAETGRSSSSSSSSRSTSDRRLSDVFVENGVVVQDPV